MPMLQDANLRCGTKLFVPLNDEIMELPIKTLVTEGLREEHQEWLLPERGLQWDGKSIIVEERIADRGADEGVLKDYGKAWSEGIYGRVGA
ncbi:hypothetical protein HYALB_00005009 [Hymenoscyphus albidus]|uniref:Uncharacterized protein n=1 Tax=Hymenoscyphus albidus TaxID=595503 RepID=A0A9N9LGT6_9HELO|nr:hypothetical protein HYALB_00005009 [Hymenoscyphus albidus]